MFLLWARVEGKQVYFEGFSSTGGGGASPAMQPDGRAGVGAGTPEAECQRWANRLGDERGSARAPTVFLPLRG